jgi:hypothetical protein
MLAAGEEHCREPLKLLDLAERKIAKSLVEN